MSRICLGVVMAIGIAGCAASERRAQNIAAGERLIQRLHPEDEAAPDVYFQVGYLRFEQAEALEASDAGSAAHGDFLRALERLNFVFERYPTYARRAEVAFWRAETLSGLHRWPEAATAWQTLPAQETPNNRAYAEKRLVEALFHKNPCGDGPDAGCAP